MTRLLRIQLSGPEEEFFVAQLHDSGFNWDMHAESSALIRNSYQPQLLALEAEKVPFMRFKTWLEDLARKCRESGLHEGDLRPLKRAAAELNLVAMSLHGECLELSSQVDPPEVDQELTAVHIYQEAAFCLATYFMRFSKLLEQVARATSRWPADRWDFSRETSEIDRWAENARIYRILANQQYRLDQLEDRVP